MLWPGVMPPAAAAAMRGGSLHPIQQAIIAQQAAAAAAALAAAHRAAAAAATGSLPGGGMPGQQLLAPQLGDYERQLLGQVHLLAGRLQPHARGRLAEAFSGLAAAVQDDTSSQGRSGSGSRPGGATLASGSNPSALAAVKGVVHAALQPHAAAGTTAA